MRRTNLIAGILIGLSSYVGVTPQAAAATSKINSAQAGITLNATLPPQLKLSIAEVNLDIRVDDVTRNSAIVAVPLISSWALDSSTNKVEMVGYFDSPERALSDEAGHMVPSSHVVGGISQEEMLPFTETSRIGSSNASRTLFRQEISAANAVSSRSDMLHIQIGRIDDLGLPPAEYRGVLHLRLVSY